MTMMMVTMLVVEILMVAVITVVGRMTMVIRQSLKTVRMAVAVRIALVVTMRLTMMMAMVMMKKTMVMTVMLTVMLFVGCRCDCMYTTVSHCRYTAHCAADLAVDTAKRLLACCSWEPCSEKIKAGSLLFVALPIRAASAGPIAAGPIACTCIGLPSEPIV